jgi:hypothetical protein
MERAMGIEQIQSPEQGVTARSFTSIGVKILERLGALEKEFIDAARLRTRPGFNAC